MVRRLRPAAHRAIGAFGLAVAASACALTMSFDGYDTSSAPRRFALAGSIDGLAADDRATLTLNGTQAFVLPNGPFSLPSAVVDGAGFTVTATAPGSKCLVDHGTGDVRGADVIGVDVHCLSSDARITALAVQGATLDPRFDPSVNAYRGVVSWRFLQTSVTATLAQGGSFLVDEQGPFVSGSLGGPLSFADTLDTHVTGIAPSGDVGLPFAIALRRNDYLKASNTRQQAAFGAAVAISADGNTVAIGAPHEDGAGRGVDADAAASTDGTDAGAVYVFARTSGGWLQQAYVKAPNTRPPMGDSTPSFGAALALSRDGNLLVVSSPYENGNGTGVNGDMNDASATPGRGAVYVFARTADRWAFEAYLKPTDAFAAGLRTSFGASLALTAAGDRLAVGCTSPDVSGLVYTFVRTTGATPWWNADAKIDGAADASLGATHDFGGAVALDGAGSTLVVGDPSAVQTYSFPGANFDIPGGRVHVFTRTGSSWSRAASVDPPPPPRTDDAATFGAGLYPIRFGHALSVDAAGDLIAVGAPSDRGYGVPGASQVNDVGSVALLTLAASRWSVGRTLHPANVGTNLQFGTAVQLSAAGDALAIGAWRESGTISGGVMVPPAEAIARPLIANGGAVYLAERAADWATTVYIKAPHPAPEMLFGSSLALSADGATLVVGARGDASSAVGVNGDQTDPSDPAAGAAFVY